MVFASISFIFFILPLFFILDIAARWIIKSTMWRNIVLFSISLLFYLWGEGINVFLLLALGIINYIAGRYLPKSKYPRLLLIIFVCVNLGILIGFKYAYWLVSLVVPSIMPTKVSMPLGISFFTFHAISYLIDVYRKHINPAKTALDFLTYFCMFSHLVAGPIVRYAHVQDALAERGPDKNLFAFGMYRFLVGINKKVIIANSVAAISDTAFNMSATGSLHFFDAWLGIMAYAIQIYFDFSGYSDMAIGLAAMSGFKFEENFKRPYSSASVRDFWRRWHISLSSWLRDYLYIPLGGSKSGNLATYRNLLLVFLLCGLWHGANVTFIVWGLWHGLFLVLERLPFGRMIGKLPVPISRCYVMLVILTGWVFFRADSFNAAIIYLKDMFIFYDSTVVLTYHVRACIALIAGIALCLMPDKIFPAPTSRNTGSFSAVAFFMQTALSIISIAMLLTGSRNPFIYFNF